MESSDSNDNVGGVSIHWKSGRSRTSRRNCKSRRNQGGILGKVGNDGKASIAKLGDGEIAGSNGNNKCGLTIGLKRGEIALGRINEI